MSKKSQEKYLGAVKSILAVLDRLWKKGMNPEDLDQHYFLFWFLLLNGNIVKAAKHMGVHRNTIQGWFKKFGFSNKSVQMRIGWAAFPKKGPGLDHKSFYQFYSQKKLGPVLSEKDHMDLSRLWCQGFKLNSLTAHYMLWALRNGMTKRQLMKKFDLSYRHVARILALTLDPKSRVGKDLVALKPSRKEIYLPRCRKK